jgi:palmitoyl-protein thioesterase
LDRIYSIYNRSPHNGISELPFCGNTGSLSDQICNFASRFLIRPLVYSSYVQNRIIPAQYFKDVQDNDYYLKNNKFLPEFNNEKVININYRLNRKLERLVLIKFSEDLMVRPPISGWFGTMNGTDKTDISFQNLPIFNRLGLDRMYDEKRLHLHTIRGPHMYVDNYIWTKFLKRYLI